MYHSLMAGKDTMPTSARAQARLTYQDFLRIPDDGKRHEIIDGVHYVTPSPNLRHQQLSGRLHYAIEHYLRRHPGVGEVFYAPFDVVLSNWDVVEPDLLLVLSDQRTILTEQNVQGAPALVIEILSPTTRRRDETIKRKLFERVGVREYWLVDPRDRSVVIFLRTVKGEFTRSATLLADESSMLTTPLLPDFCLNVSQFFG
jgi:Uma2 family endonuclease